MNTNGSGGGDTWGRECRGWALPVEPQGHQGGEASHMLLWGLLASPKKHPEGKGCRQPPSSRQEVTFRHQECWIWSPSGAQGAKGLHLPQCHPWP